MRVWARATDLIKKLGFYVSVPPLRRWIRGRREAPSDIPPVGLVRFGSLRRLDPISREWGEDRGGPVDRYYIERFLESNRSDIRGRVLEIGGDVYTRWFGKDQVVQSDIFAYSEEENDRAAFIGDLTAAPQLPSDSFDCVIVTQTFQLIYDVKSAVATVYRILAPGGVALITAPGISQINRRDSESWGDYWCWNFTALSMRRLFSEHFQEDNVHVGVHGNVLVATAFLYGLGRNELSRKELDHLDADYELLITLRAEKEAATP